MTSFARAHLLLEDGSRIDFWFNPTTLQRDRQASYNSCGGLGQAAPTLEYVGSSSDGLSVSALLHAQADDTGDKVKDAIDALEALVQPTISVPDTDQLRPPHVQFAWGAFITPDSVCESVGTTIELFDTDGTPLRAVVNIRLKQVRPELADDSGVGAMAGELSHLVQAGETLAHVAHSIYGDVKRWRSIAEASNIDDPLRHLAGSVLKIPLGRL